MVDGPLGTADRGCAMKSNGIEATKYRQIESFRARICDHRKGTAAGSIEVDQVDRSLHA